MTLLLQTEDLVAERRAVRVADIAAATQAALLQLERLQAVAAATSGTGARSSTADAGIADGRAAPLPAAVENVDTADIQQQLLAAAADAAGSPPMPNAMTSNASMLGPGMAAPFSIQSNESYQTPDGKTVPCEKAVEILVRMLAEKEKSIAQQYRAAARQAIQGMQADVLRSTQRHDDLQPDIFLSRIRRILPSEYLAAWSAWTGIFTLINADNNVMFAMWALYSVLALGYVYLRLVKDRRIKTEVDAAELSRDLPAVLPVRGGAATRRGGDVTKTITIKTEPLAMVPSVAGVDAVSMSHCGEKGEIPDDDLETASGVEHSGSDRLPARLMGRRWRARGGRGGRALEAVRSPTNLQLFLQALVSAVAFMLLSAFAADIHTTIGAPVWVFFAPVAPFALFAQFVLPDGLVSRR